LRYRGRLRRHRDDFSTYGEKFYYESRSTADSSRVQNVRTGEFIFVDTDKLVPIEVIEE